LNPTSNPKSANEHAAKSSGLRIRDTSRTYRASKLTTP
jgi:hypothetical protein